MPSKISKVHGIELVNVIHLSRRGSPCVVEVDGALNEQCMIMGLEGSDDALVYRLNMCYEVWCKIHNTDGLKPI